MMDLISKIRATLRRVIRDDRAVAVIEFAYAAPVFLVLVLGGLELTNLALVYQRVNHMSSTVADNAGRAPEQIDESDIYEFLTGADLIGRSIDFEEHGRVILSSFNRGRDGLQENQKINWQRCWGELDVGSAYGKQGNGSNTDKFADGIGPEGNKISVREGSALMFVEVVYDYQPLVGTGWFTPPQIRAESAFNVRGRLMGNISNQQDLDKLLCD